MNGDDVSTIRRPLRAYLLWLVLATLLPGIVGASLLFVHQYQKARAQFEKNTMQTVRALVHTVESKLLRGQAIAQTLSTAEALEREDFARVHRQAREALSLTGASMNAVLRDRRGQQVMNTAVDFGAALPLDHSPQIDKVFSTGRPSVANVFTGAVRRRPTVSVDVPVLVRGEIAYVLSIGLRPDYFDDVLTPKSVPEGSVASIFDAAGVIFGRNVSADVFIGRRVTESLFKTIQRSREGVFGATTQEGVDVLTFYSRSELTGWGVAVGVPRAALIQSLLQPLAVLLTGLALLFAIGLWLAWQIGGRLARSVRGLHEGAVALGRGEPAPPFREAYVREAAEVAESIGTASRLLAERAQALAAKERSCANRTCWRASAPGTGTWPTTASRPPIRCRPSSDARCRPSPGCAAPCCPRHRGSAWTACAASSNAREAAGGSNSRSTTPTAGTSGSTGAPTASPRPMAA